MVWFKHYHMKVPHASPEVGSFWWNDILRLNVLYRGISKCAVGDGSTVTFWEDLWSEEIMATKFFVFFSFVRNNNSSVQELLNAEDLDSILHLPLSHRLWKNCSSCNRNWSPSHIMQIRKIHGPLFGVAQSILLEDITRWFINICKFPQFSESCGVRSAPKE